MPVINKVKTYKNLDKHTIIIDENWDHLCRYCGAKFSKLIELPDHCLSDNEKIIKDIIE